MIRINRPAITPEVLFDNIVSEFAHAKRKSKFNSIKHELLDASIEFEQKITTGAIYTIARVGLHQSTVSNENLKALYTTELLDKNKTNRAHYENILLLAPLAMCPYCAHRDVSTLDHYLPKAEYPKLSISPINLVPSCKDCNTGKRSSYPVSPETETLHPYYDNVDVEAWLQMNIINTTPLSVDFYIARIPKWGDLLNDRIIAHFESYNLNQLYKIQSARELVAMKQKLERAFSANGEDGVKKILAEEAESRASQFKNLWQVVLYNSLAEDQWFCAGGFHQIGG